MDFINNRLLICSYNMHGFNQGENFLRNNIDKFDVLCLQEHWLYPSTITEMCDISDEYEFKVISCMSDDEFVAVGRPKGGISIAWKKSLNSVVKYIGNSLNNRVMAVIIECDTFKICLCNVYFPCFEPTVEYTTELMECLSYIENVYEQSVSICNSTQLCIIGDFNIDMYKI
jgi:exonuclease III